VIDPAYKVVLLMWAKDLAETAVMVALAYPVLRRTIKKYFADLKCPHCGKTFGGEIDGKNRQSGNETPRPGNPGDNAIFDGTPPAPHAD